MSAPSDSDCFERATLPLSSSPSFSTHLRLHLLPTGPFGTATDQRDSQDARVPPDASPRDTDNPQLAFNGVEVVNPEESFCNRRWKFLKKVPKERRFGEIIVSERARFDTNLPMKVRILQRNIDNRCCFVGTIQNLEKEISMEKLYTSQYN